MRWGRRLWLAAGCSHLAVAAAAQERGGTVHGIVLEASRDAPLGEVLIVPAGDEGGPGAPHALTSPSGRFALRVGRDSVRLLAARIGFAPETLLVRPGAGTVFRLLPDAVRLDPLVVAAEPALSAASSRVVRDLDIRLRPRETAQELLRLAPGLVIAQHAGGGKAEQIFLRGFDADHGTDVAISVDGVPVNLVSHGHGQGYADLHFLMPEVVERGEVRKGPYDARDGNLATAGAVSFRTRDRVERGTVEVRGGSFGTAHALALLPVGGDARRAGGYLALSGHLTDGPVVRPQDYRRVNGFGKLTAPLGRGAELLATASAFGSDWNASGQIPARAVRSGRISRFGSIDDSEGGSTSRYDLTVGLRSAGGERPWELRAYAVKYDFELLSNFTFFLNDADLGDGIRQSDDRWIVGADASFSGGATSAGLGLRADWADVRLEHQVRRRLLETRADARIAERHGFAWLRQEVRLAPAVRLELGLRGDLFHFDVDDHLAGAGPATLSATRLSPKASLSVQAAPGLALYANTGLGFHSNDARAAVLAAEGGSAVPRATGAELGSRYTWRNGAIAAALWGLDLESELVYVGDEGTTEAGGRTRRYGVDLEGRLRLTRWLWADADVTVSRGRLRDEPPGADRIPLAPPFTAVAGLTARDAGPIGGGLRMRHVGGRAAIEDGSVRARGYTVFEVFGRWALSRFELVAAVDNLFDVEWNEAQFATTSRLQDEPSPVTELHFTPGPGRGLQVGVEYGF